MSDPSQVWKTRNRRVKAAALIITAAFLVTLTSVPICALAQSEYQLDGNIYDFDNPTYGISGAHLVFTDRQTGLTYEAWTMDSYYSLMLPSGTYDVRIEAGGYEPFDAVVVIDQPKSEDIYLSKSGGGGGETCVLEGIVRGEVQTITTSPDSSGSSSSSGSSGPIEDPIRPLPGVHLSFTEAQTQQEFDTYTDGNGRYSIDLPYGFYSVRIEKDGYIPANEEFDANQPTDFREFFIIYDYSSSDGGGGGDDGGGSDFEGGLKGIIELSTLSIAIFSWVLLVALCVTIVAGVVIFIMKLASLRK